MGVDVCVLALVSFFFLMSTLALSSAMISKKMAKIISRRIGPSYRNNSRLFEKV
jgi:hypothetical protein